VPASSIAGLFAGVGTAGLFRGRRNVIPAAIVWSLIGFTGQLAVNFSEGRERVEVEVKEKRSIWDSRWSPLTKLSDEEYEGILREKLVRVEAELAIVDEDLAMIREEKSRQLTEDDVK